MVTPRVDLGPYLNPGLATARPELTVEVAPAAHPVLMLPVRLETRFFATDDGITELRVRVYPDKIHLDSHDPALSGEEQAAGRAYWEQRWRAADDEDRLRQAWAELSDRFGPGRAAWIARRLTPTNPDDRPSALLAAHAPLPVAPRFPDVGPATIVVRTPVAQALPDRWVATAYRDGAVVGIAVGVDLAGPLAVGPDLDPRLAPQETDDEPAVDEGMRWMVDFDQAERVGMALRMPLKMSLSAAAVDVLVVSGVMGGTADDGRDTCAALVDSHRFTDGFGLLEPGTPSNNTAAGRSAWSDQDRGGSRSYAAEWSGATVTRGDGSAAGELGAALGLPDPVVQSSLGAVPGATGTDLATAEAMTTALWPATWGYYLTQQVGLAGAGVGPPLGLDDVRWAAEHARDFLRPGGPLPTMRCGRQPYGVLPVTSLARFVDTSDDGTRLAHLRKALGGMRVGVWRPGLRTVPRVGATDNPSGDLVDVLRSDAQPTALRIRRLMGPHFLRHLRLFLGEDLDAMGFWQGLQTISGRGATQASLGFLPALSRSVFEGSTFAVVAPFVAPDDAGPEAPAYLAELLQAADLDALAAPVPTDRIPVLHALLRHALLREYARLGAALLDGGAVPTVDLVRDAELVDLVPGETPAHGWRWQRSQVVPGSTRTVREATADLASLPVDTTLPVREVRAALEHLTGCDTATLERHLLDHLGVASYRLDVWVTSLATRRLHQLRQASPEGLRIGGYGWLEGLRPEARTPVDPAPPGESGPVFLPASDPGFIHAPSLDQAATAALLRNAHLAHGGGRDGAYAIQLTSARVRGAMRLLDGVRQGQGLGALLGYDFERALHETHPVDDPDGALDEFIDDFRRIAPPPDIESEDAAARRVLLDGLVLVQLWRDKGPALLSRVNGIGQPGTPKFQAVVGVLDALDRALDGVADAVTAEGVFQLVRGNLSRASSTLEDITRGEATPPELTHQRTPRSGLPATHRVALLLDADDTVPDPSGWAPADSSPRAAADPALNAWLARVLGPARRIRLDLKVTGPDGPLPSPRGVRLSDIGITPLDVLRLGAGASGHAELALLAYRAAVPADERHPTARIAMAPPDPGARSAVTVWDLLEVAAQAATLISKSRPLDATDLAPPHAETAPGLDLEEYDTRATVAHERLRDVTDAIATVLADAGTPATVADAVRAAAAFGVSVGTPADDGLLAAVAPTLLAELRRRVAEADATVQAPAGEGDAERRARIVRRFAAVFGPGFVPAPRFAISDSRAMRDSLRDHDALLAGDNLAGQTWWLRMARLRPPLAQLDLVLRESEALGTAAVPELEVAQVPHQDGQRWVALPPAPGESLREGVVSLALHGTGVRHVNQPLTGYLLDEWTEVVPTPTETTGLAFRYDPPDAAPPQAVLLAVPPVPDEPWTVGTLNQVLLETLDLAHLRTCGPEQLRDLEHYLPATTLAFNLDGDAVSTDLNSLIP